MRVVVCFGFVMVSILVLPASYLVNRYVNDRFSHYWIVPNGRYRGFDTFHLVWGTDYGSGGPRA